MDIRFIDIKNDKSDIKKIKRLYNTAFPYDERAPFGMLRHGAKKENVDFFSCRDGDEWVGLLYVVNHLDLSYIFYFAVDETKRGRGYGTAILRAALEYYKDRRFFLAIEEVDEKYDNYDQRVKRLHFYENAGFIHTGQKINEGNVIFDLMGVNGRVSNKEYRGLMRTFMGLRMLYITLKILED